MKYIICFGAIVALSALGVSLLNTPAMTSDQGRSRREDPPSARTSAQSIGNGMATNLLSTGRREAGTPAAGGSAHETQATFYPSIFHQVSDWKSFVREAKSITVAPYDDIPIEFQREFVKEDGRFVTWIGTNRALPGSMLVSVAGPRGTFDSIMTTPAAGQISLHTDRRGVTSIHEADPSQEICGLGAAPSVAPSYETVSVFLRVVTPETQSAQSLGDALSAITVSAATINVDVLFVYDKDALSWASMQSSDPLAFLEGQTKAKIEAGNVVLANSLITNFQWRYAGMVASTDGGPSGTNMNDYLTAMVSTTSYGNWIKQQRNLYGADQVVFLKGDTAGSASGLAYQGGGGRATNSASAVAAVLVNTSYKTLIHELAHNFGAGHDRTTDKIADGDGFYHYGMVWLYSPATGGTFRAADIMGYGSYSIPYFSNPTLRMEITSDLAGSPAAHLSWGVQNLGVGIGQPTAAYVSRTLVDNATTMASNYASPEAAPSITTQPGDSSLKTGDTLSLSVTATGGGLLYQWYKDGAAISGATQSSYSRTGADATVAGAYYVKITNLFGAVDSRTASVTVSTVTTPPPSGGSGGGGGGAPSGLFVAIIAALTIARGVRAQIRGLVGLTFVAGCSLVMSTSAQANDFTRIVNAAAGAVRDAAATTRDQGKQLEVAPSVVKPLRNPGQKTLQEFVGEPIDDRHKVALSHVLGGGDEIAFIKAVRFRQQRTDDEFGKVPANEEEQENKAALDWARRVASGEALLPVSLDIELFRYNPENESFITRHWRSKLNLAVNYPHAAIKSVKWNCLRELRVQNWTIFSAIKMSPDVAEQLLLDQRGDRRVAVHALFRLNAQNIQRKYDSLYPRHELSVEADLIEYEIGPAEPTLWPTYNAAMTAAPYARTKSEQEFGQRISGRSFFGQSSGLHFRADGTYLPIRVSANATPKQKAAVLADATPQRWFLVNGKILFVNSNDTINSLKAPREVSLDGDVLRLDGVPWKEDVRLQMTDDGDISYR